MERSLNPYESPAMVEPDGPTVIERMNRLREEFESRYSRFFSDGVMAAQFSAVFSLIALKWSEDPRVAGGVAVATTIAIGAGAIHDFAAKVMSFPAKMNALRSEAAGR
jgi:hypothetical protein